MTEADPRTAFVKMAQEPGSIYLDVRSVEEYDQGHPEGSWNLPIAFLAPGGLAPNPEFEAVAERVLPRDVLLVVGCKSGPRSRMACQLLARLGYERLINVDGGFHGVTDALGRPGKPGWSTCGLPSSAEPTPGRSWDDLRAAARD